MQIRSHGASLLVLVAMLPAAGLAAAAAAATPAQAGSASSRPASLGLTVAPGGVLLHEGRAFRGVGVNYFDAFARTLNDGNDTSYDAGFAALARRKIPFARFMCCGYWPAENRLYLRDKAEYFRRLDGVVKSAERHGIGLIPSMFWQTAGVPDLMGEPCDQWGQPTSKTCEFLRAYTREVVTRYRSSPAIWGWQFGNEYNLAADLPNASEHRPPVVPKLGTPAERSARDDLTSDAVRVAFAEFARQVRRIDGERIITTGDALPRRSAWHQRKERSWTADTAEQFAEVLLGDHADPVSVIGVHVYELADRPRLAAAAEAARKAGKPLFVGEFGVPGPPTDKSRREFADLLAAVEQSGAPLAALWVYDFAGQKEQWSVTPDNERAWQLDAIAEANGRMGGGHGAAGGTGTAGSATRAAPVPTTRPE